MRNLISIIIPIFNGEKYLERCLDSVLSQTYTNLEILLIDDGSTDSSYAICKKYSEADPRISYFYDNNHGVSHARNLGINMANGQYIAFIDCDDYIDKNYIELLYKNMMQQHADLITCGYKQVYHNRITTFNDDGKIIIYDGKEFVQELLNVQNGYGFVHTKLIKRSSIKDIRFSEELKVGEDALFNIMLCKNLHKIVVFHKALYYYFHNEDSAVHKFDKNYVKKYLKSMKCMRQYICQEENSFSNIETLNNYIAYHVLLICVNYCFHPYNKNGGRKLIKEVCAISLFNKAIKEATYDRLSMTRKISLFTLKHHLYGITSLICYIRQKQFKKK